MAAKKKTQRMHQNIFFSLHLGTCYHAVIVNLHSFLVISMLICYLMLYKVGQEP